MTTLGGELGGGGLLWRRLDEGAVGGRRGRCWLLLSTAGLHFVFKRENGWFLGDVRDIFWCVFWCDDLRPECGTDLALFAELADLSVRAYVSAPAGLASRLQNFVQSADL